jgi:glyceraldehyde 3-phosphate dehydrogenase
MTSMALRVPVITGSIIDLTIFTESKLDRDQVNATFKKAAEEQYKGIIEYSELPLVSSDIIANKYSAIFDSKLTLVRIICFAYLHGTTMKRAILQDSHS